MTVPTLVTFDASAAQTTSPISHTIPAGWAEGDLVIAWIWTGVRTISSTTSGFDLVVSEIAGTEHSYSYKKILTAGDLGASKSWTLNANPSDAVIVFVRITGHHATSPIDVSGSSNDGSSVTSHVSPGVITTVNDCLIVRLFNNGNQVTTVVSGDTGTLVYEVTSGMGRSAYKSSKVVAGDTGTATYSTSAARRFSKITIAVAPGASGKSWYNQLQQQLAN